MKKKKKKKFVNTSNIHTTYKFLGEEPCNKMELEINRLLLLLNMNFSIKDFFSKCDQIRRKVRVWSHLLKKS